LASWGGGNGNNSGAGDGSNDRNNTAFDALTPNALFSAAASSLAEQAVREALRDPLSALMAGTGVPLGIRLPRPLTAASAATAPSVSLRLPLHSLPQQQPPLAVEEAEVIDVVECSNSGDDIGSNNGEDGLDRLLPQGAAAAALAASASGGGGGASAAAGGGWAHRGFSSLGGGAGGGNNNSPGGKDDGDGDGDSWGTTRQSAAEIARRIADSNAAADADADADEGADPSSSSERSTDHLDDLLSDPAFAASLTGTGEDGNDPLEALKADLRAMDEIFEVVAQVPWMDGDELDDGELRGVVAVGLLGTLEEVGFAALRGRVRRVWAGERDVSLLSQGAEPREAAALLSVLYHTRRLEERHGKASDKGMEAAVKAADAAQVDVDKAAALAAALEASGERTGK
jgi:hypothetical protein